MGDTIQLWLAVLSAASAVISWVVFWGFYTGRFVQKQQNAHTRLVEQLARAEASISAVEKSRGQLADSTTAALGRLRITLGRLESEMRGLHREHGLRAEHVDRRIADMLDRFARIEGDIQALQQHALRDRRE